MAAVTDPDLDLLETDLLEEEEALADALENESALDIDTAAFVRDLVEKIWLFILAFSDVGMFPYQEEPGKRIVESIITNDGEEITILMSRQSGKTETLANVIAALMVLLPKLALLFPQYKGTDGKPLLEKFKLGLWVGVFAPIEQQADTLFGRIVSRLTSDHALEFLQDDEIDDAPAAGSKFIRLKKNGSFCRMQTANPRAKIESKSYHLILIDEAQDADDYVVQKSIGPMGAFYNATRVMTGTPTTHKGVFYRAIQLNKRRQTRSRKRNHFEYDWRSCAKYNPNYAKFIKREILRLGEDSDEFQLSYAVRWLLERGMFVTSLRMDELGDKSMEVVKAYTRTPVVVGIDPARNLDSTVVTVVWVDWDRPDEFGYFDHRVLNWLELHGDDWETQYGRIIDFLSYYLVWGVAVDAQGMGGPVAERLAVLLPSVEVQALDSTRPAQSDRWKHLNELVGRGMVSWPAHAKTRRLKTWKRFYQQMTDLEKKYEGPHLMAMAPDEAEAHDDYPDSLALACVLTKEYVVPNVEVINSPFYSPRQRR